MMAYPPPAKLLTIAGSDSGGAAGAQADLRCWAVLGVYGMSALTAITAQNSYTVAAVHPVPTDLIAAQLDAILEDYGADAAKTGFLGRVEVIELVATKLSIASLPFLVVDPVLVNYQGRSLFPTAVASAYSQQLFPLASLITPTLAEAELLLGQPIHSLADADTAVRRLHALGAQQVLLKRIPAGNQYYDLLFDGQQTHRWGATKIETQHTHGAGDTLSAAVAAFLAQGQPMATAVSHAHQFTAKALQLGANWQLGSGHGPVFATPPPVSC